MLPDWKHAFSAMVLGFFAVLCNNYIIKRQRDTLFEVL